MSMSCMRIIALCNNTVPCVVLCCVLEREWVGFRSNILEQGRPECIPGQKSRGGEAVAILGAEAFVPAIHAPRNIRCLISFLFSVRSVSGYSRRFVATWKKRSGFVLEERGSHQVPFVLRSSASAWTTDCASESAALPTLTTPAEAFLPTAAADVARPAACCCCCCCCAY